MQVTPFAGVWIEILLCSPCACEPPVTPFAGVWIEIAQMTQRKAENRSLPSRECGLKCLLFPRKTVSSRVTPFAGVWIEIFAVLCLTFLLAVTPFAGVWIEIRETYLF